MGYVYTEWGEMELTSQIITLARIRARGIRPNGGILAIPEITMVYPTSGNSMSRPEVFRPIAMYFQVISVVASVVVHKGGVVAL